MRECFSGMPCLRLLPQMRLNFVSLQQFLKVRFVVFPVVDVIIFRKIQFFVLVLIFFKHIVINISFLICPPFKSFNYKFLFLQTCIILMELLFQVQYRSSEMSHPINFFFQIGFNILTSSLCFIMQLLYYPRKLPIFFFSIPKLVVYFFVIIYFIQFLSQFELLLLSLEVQVFLLVAFLFGSLESVRCCFYLSFVLVYFLPNLVFSFHFFTKSLLLGLELLNINFQFLYCLGSLFFLSLANLDVFLDRLKPNFELSSHFRKLLFLCFVFLIKQCNTSDKGLIILNVYSLFFGSFDLVIAAFKQFGPITLDILQFANNVQQILTSVSVFFFQGEDTRAREWAVLPTLSTLIMGLLMYINYIRNFLIIFQKKSQVIQYFSNTSK